MIDFNKILKTYNELDGELSRLKDISSLSKDGYFESLLSDIDWHIYFLYRIKDKEYFNYFLLDKEFWEEVKKDEKWDKILKENGIKNNISLKNYDYKKGFELFDKIKNDDIFVKYFNKYKTIQIEKIINKQKILKFSTTLNILQKLKEYKPDLEIDFFDFKIDDYEDFSKSGFSTEKSIISEYLRKSAIYDFNFEKFYLLKREELDKKISLGEGKINDFYHDLGILNTYNRFYKLYNNLVNLSYSKIILLKAINLGNMFDENKKYLLTLLIFHLSKNRQEAKKINFIFKNHFVEFIILISLLLILGFGNIYLLILVLIFFILLFIITKLVVYLIDNFNLINLFKISFSIIILFLATFSVFINPITNMFLSVLPQKGVISMFVDEKTKINKDDVNKEFKKFITDLYKKINKDNNLGTDIVNINKK